MSTVERKRRLLTVALNAAVDVTYTVPRFEAGKIHAAAGVHKVAGGKANNVARVLVELGCPVTATGFAGGANGRFVREALKRCGVDEAFVQVAGETRTCITILDPAAGRVTELREPGPVLSCEETGLFRDHFEQLIESAGLVVLSGSLPPGVSQAFYATLIDLARRRGVRSVLDSSKGPLREALDARPFLVKPNRDELAEWAGASLPTLDAVRTAAVRLQRAGAENVAVSLGAEGMLYITEEGAWHAVPPAVEALNTVGSGDSAVAGMALALWNGRAPEEVVRMGAACGTANALTQGVAEVRSDDVNRILDQVIVRRI